MDGFIRTTKPALSGSEKVAILLAEIGPFFNSNYDELFEKMHLSADEIKKVRKAMKKLGRYAPAKKSNENGLEQIAKEQSVLQEVLEFGARRGIAKLPATKETAHRTLKDFILSDVKNIAKQNPVDVANVLRSWLKE